MFHVPLPCRAMPHALLRACALPAAFAAALLAQQAEFAPAPARGKKQDYLLTIATPHGEMKAVLFDATPLHKANFAKLAHAGYFDSTMFHRVIPGFMIQGGDPHSKPGGNAALMGQGSPGYRIPAEFVPGIVHQRGSLAAARDNNPKMESNGSQFYIVQHASRCKHLDGSYTVFGQVISGLEAVDAIANLKRNRMDRPDAPVYMRVGIEVVSRKKITKTYKYKYPGAAQ